MAITANGTTGVITTSSAITPPNRYSFSFIYRNGSAPGTATVNKPFAISNSTSDYDVSFCWDHTSTPRTLFHRRSGGTYDQATIPAGVLTSNTDYVIGGRYDGSNLTVFVDGVAQSTVTASDPTAAVNPTPALFAGSAGTGNFDDGTGSTAALWNVALTDAEFLSLGRRFTPDQIRPESLLFYWPLIRETVAMFGTIATAGGLTVAVHPRIIEGFSAQCTRYTADATYVLSSTGGMTFGGTSTVVADYVLTPTGGVTFGGASTVEIGVGFTTSMNFSSGVDRAHLRATVAFASSFALLDQFGSFTTGLVFGSKFSADSGYLLTGRIRDKLE